MRCTQWFALAFILHWVGLVAIAGTFGPGFIDLIKANIPNTPTGNRTLQPGQQHDMLSILGVLCVSALIGAFGAGFFLWLIKRVEGRVVKVALALNIVIDLLALVVCFVLGSFGVGVLLLVWFVILCVWAYAVRNRIPFAEAVLTAASHVSTPHSNTPTRQLKARHQPRSCPLTVSICCRLLLSLLRSRCSISLVRSSCRSSCRSSWRSGSSSGRLRSVRQFTSTLD